MHNAHIKIHYSRSFSSSFPQLEAQNYDRNYDQNYDQKIMTKIMRTFCLYSASCIEFACIETAISPPFCHNSKLLQNSLNYAHIT